MVEPCPESHESSLEACPPPSSQGGGSGPVEVDVGRKMEKVVHLLEELKESVTELGDHVAGIKAEVEDVHKKITAEAERKANKMSIALKIRRNLIKQAVVGAATVSGLGVIVYLSCVYAIGVLVHGFLSA